MNDSSRALCLTSTPWPRAITGSSNKSARREREELSALAAGSAAWAETMAKHAIKNAERNISKFHDADIADVAVGLDFVEQGRRRHAVEVQDGEGLAAGIVAAQAHARDIYIV